MNDQSSTPLPPGEGTVVRENQERPVVRDSADNPVVRKRDLESAIAPLDTRQKVGFAVIGAIGVANLFGVKATAPQQLPAGLHRLAELLTNYL